MKYNSEIDKDEVISDNQTLFDMIEGQVDPQLKEGTILRKFEVVRQAYWNTSRQSDAITAHTMDTCPALLCSSAERLFQQSHLFI